MSKCPFISRTEAIYYANWEGAQKVALLIDELPDPDPKELILTAMKMMNSDQLTDVYLALSESFYRGISNKCGKQDTVYIGGAHSGSVVEVGITVKDDIKEGKSDDHKKA